MKTSGFDYQLPTEYIAQTPVEPRDHSRLMVLDRAGQTIEHRRFYDILDCLRPGDLLVCNESRVIPARLFARRADTGGRLEILLLKQLEDGVWETLVKPGKRARPGTRLILENGRGSSSRKDLWDAVRADPSARASDSSSESLSARAAVDAGANPAVTAEVLERTEDGARIIRFSDSAALEALGTVPLPPYIKAPLACPERYQTVYARLKGSVAAPTAGLHFTPELIARVQALGVEFAFVTLHIGLDTFRPVEEDDAEQHAMHSEYIEIGEEAAAQISRAKGEGRRVVAVGTTTVRALEAGVEKRESGAGSRETGGGSQEPGAEKREARVPLHPLPSTLDPYAGYTRLFILPGYEFRVVDALVTNFHLPRSTLLMLVSAFAGRDFILHAYAEAVRQGYRFYSFGDAMLIQ